MSVTRALACLLLIAQVLWAVSASARMLGPGDRGQNELPADPLLDEIEEEGEKDRVEPLAPQAFCCPLVAASLKHVSRFLSERTDDCLQTHESIALDLHASRAPPSLLERLS